MGKTITLFTGEI
uniref:Uncharacterized protein n=1 Tax=Anguilla anguilla TaxID=7936 RepID=A0A0E9UYI9_ANGAN